jgi:hypothetical protein
LTGWGVLIDDVAAWRAEGGGYYECDPKVKSEVCLPIVDEHDRVLGILDAESSQLAILMPAVRYGWQHWPSCWLHRLLPCRRLKRRKLPSVTEYSPPHGFA